MTHNELAAGAAHIMHHLIEKHGCGDSLGVSSALGVMFRNWLDSEMSFPNWWFVTGHDDATEYWLYLDYLDERFP